MTISNGQPVIASDLNAMTTASFLSLQADNAQLPIGWHTNIFFQGLTSAIAAATPHRTKAYFIVPFDHYIETLAVQTGDFSVGSTVTVNINVPGILDSFPVTVSGTSGTAIVKLPRIIYDGTKGKVGAAYMPSNRALRTINRGASGTVLVTTTNAATASNMQITFVFRSYFSR